MTKDYTTLHINKDKILFVPYKLNVTAIFIDFVRKPFGKICAVARKQWMYISFMLPIRDNE